MRNDFFFAQMKGKDGLAIYDIGIGIAIIASTVYSVNWEYENALTIEKTFWNMHHMDNSLCGKIKIINNHFKCILLKYIPSVPL